MKELLLKIKKLLSEEKAETSAMLEVYFKYTIGNASSQELKKANLQFRKIIKNVGFTSYLALPFSLFTLPFIIHLGKKYDVDILPEWFKNKHKKNEDK